LGAWEDCHGGLVSVPNNAPDRGRPLWRWVGGWAVQLHDSSSSSRAVVVVDFIVRRPRWRVVVVVVGVVVVASAAATPRWGRGRPDVEPPRLGRQPALRHARRRDRRSGLASEIHVGECADLWMRPIVMWHCWRAHSQSQAGGGAFNFIYTLMCQKFPGDGPNQCWARMWCARATTGLGL
jgi:hypothetical protein